jgi:hypothetical protein
MHDKKLNIEKTLEILDEKITPEFDSYFQTRLNSRLNKISMQEDRDYHRFLKPALILFLILLNLFTVIYGFSTSDKVSGYDRKDIIEGISNEVFYSAENSTY